MREIESIESWRGQDVVSSDDEKVGSLEHAWYRTTDSDPAVISVKSGLLGRKHRLVPLVGATVARDHVRVAFTHDQIKDAPEADDDQRIGADAFVALLAYYAAPHDDTDRVDLESEDGRAARVASARESEQHAERAASEAERTEREAALAEEQVHEAQRRADAARRQHQEATDAASARRAEADAARAPIGHPTARPGIDG